jgi:hypothetical protein
MTLSYAVYIKAKNESKKATAASQQKTIIVINNPLELEPTVVKGWK